MIEEVRTNAKKDARVMWLLDRLAQLSYKMHMFCCSAIPFSAMLW